VRAAYLLLMGARWDSPVSKVGRAHQREMRDEHCTKRHSAAAHAARVFTYVTAARLLSAAHGEWVSMFHPGVSKEEGLDYGHLSL
jgi:hypothetical protein